MALGDDFILQIGGDVAALDEAVQGVEQAVLGHAQLGADTGQLCGGPVDDLGAVVDAAADFADHMLARLDAEGDIGETGELAVESGEGIAHGAGAHEGCAHFHEVGGDEHAAALGFGDQMADVVDAAEVDVGLLIEQAVGFVGLLHPFGDGAQIVAGQEGGGQLFSAGEGTEGGQFFEDFVVFENADCMWIQGQPPSGRAGQGMARLEGAIGPIITQGAAGLQRIWGRGWGGYIL